MSVFLFLDICLFVVGKGDTRMKKWRRKLPHIEFEDSVYFISFSVARGTFSPTERIIVMNHIKSGDPKFYQLFAAVIMPDHVHIILRPNKDVELSRAMKGIKGVSARKVNEYRGEKGTVWLDEYWDRIVRDHDEFEEKLNYMYMNPVKKELVKQTEDWDAWYLNTELL